VTLAALRSAWGAARRNSATKASGSSTVARPGTAGSRRARSVSADENMVGFPGKAAGSFRLSEPSCQNTMGLLHRRGHALEPLRRLASEDAAGRLHQRGGVLDNQPLPPARRHVGEVFLHESPTRAAGRLGWHCPE